MNMNKKLLVGIIEALTGANELQGKALKAEREYTKSLEGQHKELLERSDRQLDFDKKISLAMGYKGVAAPEMMIEWAKDAEKKLNDARYCVDDLKIESEYRESYAKKQKDARIAELELELTRSVSQAKHNELINKLNTDQFNFLSRWNKVSNIVYGDSQDFRSDVDLVERIASLINDLKSTQNENKRLHRKIKEDFVDHQHPIDMIWQATGSMRQSTPETIIDWVNKSRKENAELSQSLLQGNIKIAELEISLKDYAESWSDGNKMIGELESELKAERLVSMHEKTRIDELETIIGRNKLKISRLESENSKLKATASQKSTDRPALFKTIEEERRDEDRQMRSDEFIVEQTNGLAIELGKLDNWEALALCELWKSQNPRAEKYWQMACEAQKILTQTDPEDALSGIDELDDEVQS